MVPQNYHIYLSDRERLEIIESLVALKNQLLLQGKYTDAVDEVLIKMVRAKQKKLKVLSF